MLRLELITALDLIKRWVEEQGAEVTWGMTNLIIRPKWPSDNYLLVTFAGNVLGASCRGRHRLTLIADANIYNEKQFTNFKRILFKCIVVKNANKKIESCPCEMINDNI